MPRRHRRLLSRLSADKAERDFYRARGPRARSFVVWIAVVVVLALSAADAIYTFQGLRGSVTAMGDHLIAGRASLREGDLGAARESFRSGAQMASESRSFIAHPTFAIARVIPSLGRDADAVSALVEAGSSVSEAGLEAVRGGEALGGTNAATLGEALFSDGRVQIDAVERGAPFVGRVRDRLREAQASVRDVDPPSNGDLAEALVETRDNLDSAVDAADNAVTLLEALPALLGDQGRKRYLLALQSPSEARATGGIIGLYGVLEADDGEITLTHVGPFVELFTDVSIKRLAEITRFQGRVGNTDPLDLTTQINLTPNFPAVADGLLRIYRAATGRRLDGVLAMDPVALEDLIRGTGPLQVGDETLTTENTARLLLRDAYLEFERDPGEQTRFLVGVVREFHEALGSGNVDGPALVSAFGETTAGQHLKIYSANPSEQQSLIRLGVAGDLDSHGGNPQMIFHNNRGANKVDYFLRRSFETTVDINRDGTVTVTNDIEMTNDAPAAVSNGLLRSYEGKVPPGVNRMALHTLVGPQALSLRWTVGGARTPASTHLVDDLRTTSLQLEIGPGESQTVTISYEIPAAVSVLTGGSFEFALLPQATVRPDTFSLRFVPPEGFRVTARGGTPVGSGSLEYSGELDSPRSYRISVEPL